MKVQLRRETEDSHQRRWNGLTSCRQAKEFLVGCNLKTTKFLLSLSRARLRTLAGVLTGHTCLNYHLNKIGMISDSTCGGCGLEPETARHFICTCPALRTLRTKYLGDFYVTPEEQSKLDLTSVLSFIERSKRLAVPDRV